MNNIRNARITNVSLTMRDHGCLTMYMTLDGGGVGCNYGGYVLGKGYLNSKEFEGSAKGLEYIMRIMDVVGVDCFEDLKGKYVRFVYTEWGDSVTKIGNIIEDKWFDAKEFFKKDESV